MSADKYPSIFSRQIEAIVYIYLNVQIILKRVVKGIFVIREWPDFFLLKCEMACFFSREL